MLTFSLRRWRTPLVLASAAVLLVMGGLVTRGASPASAIATAVDLGTASSFSVLAGSTVTNTGPSVVSADLGVSPGSAVTGFPPGTILGALHATDAAAAQAQSDLTIAYNAAAGEASDVNITDEDLGGKTLVAGVYTASTSSQLTGTLTLDAQGDPNAVFVFQIGSTLTTASNSTVSMINGADPCNVFWQIGSSAIIGTNTTFVGTILALTSVTVQTGSTIEGRALARNGAVTLDNNRITTSDCESDGGGGTGAEGSDTGGTEGTDTAGTEGTDTAGTDTGGAEGTDTAGTEGTDTAGTEGTNAAGTSTTATEGTDTAGTDTGGTEGADTAGSDTAGAEGTDTAGTDTAGTEGTDTEGTDTEGTDTEGTDTEGTDFESSGPEGTDTTGTDTEDIDNESSSSGGSSNDSEDRVVVPAGHPETGLGGSAAESSPYSLVLFTLGGLAAAGSLRSWLLVSRSNRE